MDKQNRQWYVVYTASRAEKKTANRLEEAGFEVFLPLYSTIRQWSDRKKKLSLPLIARVVFLRGSKQDLITVYDIPGVVGVLKEKGVPAVVRAFEIKNLKLLVKEWNGEQVNTKVNNLDLKVGDEVEVISGAFFGLRGTSVQLKGKHRLLIKLDALGLEYLVDVSKSSVKKCMSYA